MTKTEAVAKIQHLQSYIEDCQAGEKDQWALVVAKDLMGYIKYAIEDDEESDPGLTKYWLPCSNCDACQCCPNWPDDEDEDEDEDD